MSNRPADAIDLDTIIGRSFPFYGVCGNAFKLGDAVLEAVEDEDDGWRSSRLCQTAFRICWTDFLRQTDRDRDSSCDRQRRRRRTQACRRARPCLARGRNRANFRLVSWVLV